MNFHGGMIDLVTELLFEFWVVYVLIQKGTESAIVLAKSFLLSPQFEFQR